MTLLCDYFVAPTDEQAAATIDRLRGPGVAERDAPSPRPGRRGLFRRRPDPPRQSPVAEQPVFPTVSANGIDPVVQMGTLEALLTGRSYDDVMAAHPGGQQVAVRDGGEELVTRLPESLTESLAAASDERLRSSRPCCVPSPSLPAAPGMTVITSTSEVAV